MSKYLIFLFKILLALNNICFINSIIFKLAIKFILFILDYLILKPRLGFEYNFRQCKYNTISTFVRPVPDTNIFSQGIQCKRNNS